MRSARLFTFLVPAAALALAGCRSGMGGSPVPLVDADAAARAALASERTLGSLPAGERTVGVVPLLAGDSALAPLGYALADLLLTDLSRSRQLKVVDRAELHAVLRELDLAASGDVDSATAPRTGRLLRASQLIVGGVAPGDAAGGIRVDTRTADVATGQLEVAVSTNTTLTGVLDAEKTIAFRLLDALGVTLTPAERAAIEQRPTRNLAALLAYGRAVRYEVEGRYAAAAAEYARAARLDAGFGAARSRLYDLRAHADVWPLPVVPVSGESRGYSAGSSTLGTAMVDNVNHTFAFGTSSPDGRSAADPAFPAAQATIILTIKLP